MKEYIERELLIKQFGGGDEMKSMSESIHDSRFIEALKKVPAADVAPVRHGEWRDFGICSNCGKNIYDGIDADIWSCYEPPYCPNCGAKMKEN